MTGHIEGFEQGAPPKPVKAEKEPKRWIKRGVKPSHVRQTPAGQEKHRKDREWSKAVKAANYCAYHNRYGGKCRTPLTAAHWMRRGYLATRHLKANGLPLCLERHDYMGRHPKRWATLVIRTIGREMAERIYWLAMRGPKAEEQ